MASHKRKHKQVKYDPGFYEKFWVASLNNGKTSTKMESLVDITDWLIENTDEKIISSILIQRKWRKKDEVHQATGRNPPSE